MDTDLLFTHNGYMLGGGNIETAVISVTFRGADLPPPEEVNGSDVPSTTAGMYFQNCPPSTHADGRKSNGPGS